jgi:hypothetical protein
MRKTMRKGAKWLESENFKVKKAKPQAHLKMWLLEGLELGPATLALLLTVAEEPAFEGENVGQTQAANLGQTDFSCIDTD